MIQQSNCNWSWRLGLLLSLTVTTNAKAIAQVTSDQTLGTQVIDIGLNSFILDGTTVGNTNLFHSFSSFNIPNGGAAVFINDPTITNIFARVTGGIASEIQGLISAQGTANLFLMNPNGIIFGRNAQLNIGGSFVATTANTIQFPGGAEFSLKSPVAPENTLLSINPTAFLFNQIANQGANSIENRGQLFTAPGKSLILLGGRVAPTLESTGQIVMDGGTIGASGGRVEIGGLTASGTVGLTVNGNDVRLSFPDDVAKSDVLLNQSFIAAFGANGSDIVINANNLLLTNGGLILSDTATSELEQTIGHGGNIQVTATNSIEIDAKDAVDTTTGFLATTSSASRGGDITLKTRNFIMKNGGLIVAEANGNLGGNAGNININASESVELISSNPDNRNVIFTGVTPFGDVPNVGNGGDLTINTKRFQLINSNISSGTFAQGNAGKIFINSSNAIVIDNSTINSRVGIGAVGNAGDIKLETQRLTLINGGQIDSQISETGQGRGATIRINATDGVTISGINRDGIASFISTETRNGAIGQGGDIIVNTDYFRIAEEGNISALTENSSNGGNITINARVFEVSNGGLVTTGTIGGGKSGDLSIYADSLAISSNINRRTGVFAGANSPESTGDGGTISLFTTNFNLFTTDLNLPNNIVSVSTRTLGRGIAGNININARENFNVKNGSISARAEQAGGGNLNVTARNINLRNNSDIRTDLSSGSGRGGNIFLTSDTIIALEDSDILAFAPEGQGGDIKFNTRAVFSDALFNYRPTSTDKNSLQSLINNGRSDINATGTISGNIIGVPDISFLQNGLTELQGNPIDINALIANSCIARSPKQESTFIITGTGSLPSRPGEAMASSYPTGDVQNITNNSTSSSWKKGDPIVEAQGVYRLANGFLVMSRKCS
ncbi:filamentous hemagglutinin N-terminal domain-containing protein [Nostoc sp. TCL26-01]|uniref:two-partner secretion domain-containing protein n=1 Tax=Nostoc sp. TCL26-01 TaxID=2576904 RepID=UPI0015BBA9B9|nr:filamentous hemagglutinin N-terminal domain-containing protein [Nostoc sp. TCL26-01]QLE57342.1 S-layer family protein [Nostoc sp. TCL26-01]